MYSFAAYVIEEVDRTNIAVTSYMQYTDTNKPGQFDASNVIDGNPSSNASSCSCCCTVNDGGWLQLDLQNAQFLHNINIKGRSDRKHCRVFLKLIVLFDCILF